MRAPDLRQGAGSRQTAEQQQRLATTASAFGWLGNSDHSMPSTCNPRRTIDDEIPCGTLVVGAPHII